MTKVERMMVKVEKICLYFVLFSLFDFAASAQSRSSYDYTSVFISNLGGQAYNDVADLHQDRNGYMWISLSGGGLVRYDGTEFLSFRTDTEVPLCSDYTTGSVDDGFDRLWVSSSGGLDIINLMTLDRSDLSSVIQSSTKGRQCFSPICTSDGAIWFNADNYLYRVSFRQNGDIHQVDSVRCSDNSDLRLTLAQIDDDPSIVSSIDGYITRVKYHEGKGLQMTNVSRSLYIGDETRATAFVRKGNILWVGTSDGLYSLNMSNGAYGTYGEPDMPSKEVTALALTAEGSIAVGTTEGLCIQDRLTDRFVCYDSTVNPFGIRVIANNLVRSLAVVGGDLWVGTDRDGISILRRKQMDVTELRHRENDLRSLPDAAIRSLFEDSRGMRMVGTMENGFFIKESDSFNFRGYNARSSNLGHNSVTAIAEDGLGRIWLGTLGGELDIMDMKNPAALASAPGAGDMNLDDVNDLFYDDINDFMWVATRSGLYYYDIRSKTIVKCYEDIRLCSCLVKDNAGNLWISHMKGLTCINLKTRGLKDYSLPFFALTTAVDVNGSLWVGSFDQGLYLFDPKSGGIKRYSMDEGLCDNRVRGLIPDGGFLWVSTAHGLCRINVNSKEIRSFGSYDGVDPYVYCENAAYKDPSTGALCFGHTRGVTVLWSETVGPSTGRPVRLTFTEGASGGKKLNLVYSDKVELKQRDRVFTARFADFCYGDASSMNIYARLYPLEKEWRLVDGGVGSLHYAGLGGGDYKLQLKAEDLSGNLLGETEKSIHVKPFFHRTFAFYIILFLLALHVWIYVYKWRTRSLKRSEERLRIEVDKQTKLLSEQKRQLERKAEELTEQNKILLKQNEALAGHRIVASAEAVAGSPARDSRFVDRVMETIRSLYKDPDLDVQTFCEAIAMSRSVLNNKVRDAFGQSVSQFIRTYRLNVAKEILENSTQGSVNVSEVAYEVGFSDPKYFTRCFSKEFGVSPSAVLSKEDV